MAKTKSAKGAVEGDAYGVPLPSGGYATVVVARISPRGITLGYFFGPRLPSVPDVGSLEGLTSQSALRVERFGDLGIVEGTWPRIGRMPHWDRQKWRTPVFVRQSPLDHRWLRVEYDDDNPNSTPRESQITEAEALGLQRDGLSGHIAILRVLDAALESEDGAAAPAGTPRAGSGAVGAEQRLIPAQQLQVVTHYVYAKSSKTCERVAAQLRRHGLSVEVEESDASTWVIRATHSLPASDPVDAAEELVSALANEAGANYDGYERGRVAVPKPPAVERPD